MKFQTALIAVLSAASFAHATLDADVQGYKMASMGEDNQLEARSSADRYCNNVSHFIDETSNDSSSPLRRDCQALLARLKTDGPDDELVLSRGGYIKGWSEGTNCAIGARRIDTGLIVRFGKGDAIHLLEDALSRKSFGKNNRIGVRGELSCDRWAKTKFGDGKEQVQFSISHNDDW